MADTHEACGTVAAQATPSRVGIMLDLETLGTAPGCVVLSIAAAAYDADTMVLVSDFRRNLDVVEQVVRAGFTIDESTVGFWRAQSEDTLARNTHNPQPVGEALGAFVNWAQTYNPVEVVCRGTDFDLPILRHALGAYGFKQPWSYRAARDLRTIIDTLGFDEDPHYEDWKKSGLAHDALSDCRYQLDILRMARSSRVVLPSQALKPAQA